jgi:hypothetical protein
VATINEIKNLAVLELGVTDEKDFSNTSSTDRVITTVNRIYDTTKNFVLSNYYWRFTLERVELTDRITETDTFTANAGTDFITINTKAQDGLRVQLTTTGVLPAGLSLATDYYTVGSTGSTCQLSLTYGGSAVDITDTGTGTHTLTYEDVANSPYKYMYYIPSDTLVMRTAYTDKYAKAVIQDYELTINGLFTDYQSTNNSIWFWYIQNTTESLFPVYFINYFKYKLALDLCFSLTGDNELMQTLALKEATALKSARNVDAKQVKTRVIKNSPFIQIRG